MKTAVGEVIDKARKNARGPLRGVLGVGPPKRGSVAGHGGGEAGASGSGGGGNGLNTQGRN